MKVVALIALIMLLAFLVESIVEYFFGKIVEKVPALQPYAWVLIYVAMVIGIGGAWVYHFDLIYLLSLFMEETLSVQLDLPTTWLGITLTGMGIGRGANFIHDIWKRFFVKPG